HPAAGHGVRPVDARREKLRRRIDVAIVEGAVEPFERRAPVLGVAGGHQSAPSAPGGHFMDGTWPACGFAPASALHQVEPLLDAGDALVHPVEPIGKTGVLLFQDAEPALDLAQIFAVAILRCADRPEMLENDTLGFHSGSSLA